jgi:hypothetical protein
LPNRNSKNKSKNSGMQQLYNDLYSDFEREDLGFQGNTQWKEHLDKYFENDDNIDMKTDLISAYPLTTLEIIAKYLDKKYGKDIDVSAIYLWCKKYKAQSVSVEGKRVTQVLDALKGFVGFMHNRNLGDRLMGQNKGNEQQ